MPDNFISRVKKKARQEARKIADRLSLSNPLPGIKNPNKTIVFVGEYPAARIQRISRLLKESGQDFHLVLYISEWGYESKLIGPYFDRTVIYRNKYNLIRNAKAEENVSLIHAFEPKAEFQYYLHKSIDAPFIYDLQDILINYYFWDPPMKWQRVNLVFEKKLFESCDGFIAQSLELNQAMRLYGVRSRKVKRLFFPLYCDNDNFRPIDESVQPASLPKLVYIGGINSIKDHSSSNFLPFIEKVCQTNKISLDIFPSPFSERLCFDEYKQLESNFNNFRMNRSVPFNQLDLTAFDFGVVPFEHNYSERYYSKTPYASTMKFFVYMEMGIPVIISEYWAFPAWVTKRYGLGIVSNFKELDHLDAQIQSLDYGKTLKNIERFRERFSLRNNFDRIICFYQKFESIQK